MTQANALLASAAVIALTLGVTGKTTAPRDDPPLSKSDITIAEANVGQTDESAEESAKMGKEESTHNGENQGNVPKSQSQEAPPE